jgi:hypothetical protein
MCTKVEGAQMKREKKGKDESVWRVEILPKDPPNKKQQ